MALNKSQLAVAARIRNREGEGEGEAEGGRGLLLSASSVVKGHLRGTGSRLPIGGARVEKGGGGGGGGGGGC